MKTTTQEDSIKYLLETFQTTETKEDFLLAFWIFWVENVTIRSRDFCQVLASASVNKWFIMQLQKEETEFRLLASRYPEIKGPAKDKLYIECVNKLMSRFPKALLDQAQKREEKAQTTKVKGIRTELAIIIQN
ncbi:MAG: hypothetical protein V4497_01410 [Bacteroidota bacterium]